MIDRFYISKLFDMHEPVNRLEYITSLCKDKVVLDLGCIRHNADYALQSSIWVHKAIVSVAKEVTGVDYLPEEIAKLNKHGYNIIYADVCERMDLNVKYDVIMAGDIIEHLVDFKSLFNNIKRLLKPGGILILTTGNPFYAGMHYYMALRGNYIVNPEHTCWLCPATMAQLLDRSGFEIAELRFIKDSWRIDGLMSETAYDNYDILNDRWSRNDLILRIKRRIIYNLYRRIYKVFLSLFCGYNAKLVKYADYVAVARFKHE